MADFKLLNLLLEEETERVEESMHRAYIAHALQKTFIINSTMSIDNLQWTLCEDKANAGFNRHQEREWMDQHTKYKTDDKTVNSYLDKTKLSTVDRAVEPKIGEFVRASDGVAKIVDEDKQTGALMVSRNGKESVIKASRLAHPEIAKTKGGDKVRVWALL